MLKKILFFAVLCFFTGTVMAQTDKQEANLKAAFIYNFTKYIDWDTSSAENNFIIGIIGSSDVTSSLYAIARTNNIKNKKIIIRQFSRPEDIEYCDILFIPQKTSYSLGSILDKTGKGILTVSEEPGFAKQGTALNLVVVNDKLRFEANLKVIYSAGLRAGSQLLKLAILVN